jgi:hypothetical protein
LQLNGQLITHFIIKAVSAEFTGEISTKSSFVEIKSGFEIGDASSGLGTSVCKTETHVGGKHSKCVHEFPYTHNWPLLHAMLMTKHNEYLTNVQIYYWTENKTKRAGFVVLALYAFMQETCYRTVGCIG